MNNKSRRYRVASAIAKVIFYGSIIALVFALTGLVWWTGEGYCLGTMEGCVGL